MALTLQLKRSKKDPSKITTILAHSEPLIVTYKDPILFVGDGKATVSELFAAGKYLYISNRQTPRVDSITTDMLQDGCITEDKLDSDLSATLVRQVDLDDFEEYLDSLSSAVIDSINFAKMHTARCSTVADVAAKEAVVSTFGEIPDDTTLDYFNETALIVTFVNSNTAKNPTLTIKDSTSRVIIPAMPIYFDDNRLADPFNWRAGDVVLLVFNYDSSKKTGRWQVSNTSALKILASWCADNDMTVINGGMIATGSITANQIASHTITADQIAVGSISSDLLAKGVAAAINSANGVADWVNSSKQLVVTCETGPGNLIKEVILDSEQSESLKVVNNKPAAGTTLLVKFTKDGSTDSKPISLNLWAGTVMLYNDDIGYYDASGNFAQFIYDSSADNSTFPNMLKWSSGDTRLLVFDGSHWIISLPSSMTQSVANWCLNNNQTFISGGNIVTGKISCAELEAGHIDAGTISLSNDDGGFAYAFGSDGKNQTSGIKMYAYANDGERVKGSSAASNYFFVTEGGVRMTCDDTSFYINTGGNYAMPSLVNIKSNQGKGFLYVDSEGFVKIGL